MANEFLVDSLAKVERTKAQIDNINVEIRSFLDKSSYEIVSKLDTERDEEIWSFRLKERVPAVIPVMIGEILHNLRSSLDQMACAVASANGKNIGGVYFPFGRDEDILKDELVAKAKKLPLDAWSLIVAAKPYKGGNDLLWNIHDLNRRDKHIHIAPVNLRTGSNNLRNLVITKGLMLVIGCRKAQHLVLAKPRPSAEEIAAMKGPTGIYRAPSHGYLSFGTAGCTPEESFEFLTTALHFPCLGGECLVNAETVSGR